jgi:hypothetical protein
MPVVDIAVSRGVKEVHNVDVTSAGVVTWRAKVQQYDIAMSVLWFPEGDSTPSSSSSSPSVPGIVVQPSLRIEEETGSYTCMIPGRLEFTLDNSFSMLRGKTVSLTLNKAPLPAEGGGAAARAASLDPMDTYAMNALCYEGIEMFFKNDFAGAEKHFEMEKNRVSCLVDLGSARYCSSQGFAHCSPPHQSPTPPSFPPFPPRRSPSSRSRTRPSRGSARS